MKSRKAIFVLVAGLTAVSSVYAEKVGFSSTPKSVQDAIRSRSGRAQIEDIDRNVRPNGQVTYEASWKVNGSQQELLVSEAGTILRDVIAPTTGLSSENLTLANRTSMALTDTPLAVREAIYNQLLGAAVDSVEKGVWNGQTIYEAKYHRNGQLMTYQVTETGRPVVGQVPPGWQPKYAGLAQANVDLSGARKMGFTEAPPAVQNTVNQVSLGSRVEDFERGQWDGRTVYQAAFKRNGNHVELQVLEDGTLLTHAPTAVGSAGQSQTGAGSQVIGAPQPPWQPRYAALADQNVQLASAQKVSFESAPKEVRRTVNEIAKGARIEDFERGQWNNRVVYEAAFKRDGKHIELQVMDDGSILTKGPAPGATPAAQP